MALIAWNETYRVNVRQCDEQHKKLFSIINALHEAMKTGQGRTIISEILHQLAEYSHTHFASEEELMERANYAGVEFHRAEHQKFVRQIESMEHELKAGRANPVATSGFLLDWLAHHIKKTDRRYTADLNAKGIN